MTPDYKKYSLDKLEEWVNDAVNCSDASPNEIYDVIKKTVEDNYYTYKHHASQCYELLALLNGNGKGHIKVYDDCVDKILSCDKDNASPECKSAWNDFWEENYYPEENCMPPWGHSDMEYLFKNSTDRVKKWVLPVSCSELYDADVCYVNLPDDLLLAANLKESDEVEWVDNYDGSYTLRKVNGTK